MTTNTVELHKMRTEPWKVTMLYTGKETMTGGRIKKAQEYTKNSSDNIEIVKDCHIVFVCSKLSETLSYLDKLNNILDKSTIVVDVASVKEENYPKYMCKIHIFSKIMS